MLGVLPQIPDHEFVEARSHHHRPIPAATACRIAWRLHNHERDGGSSKGYAELVSGRTELPSGGITDTRPPRVYQVLQGALTMSLSTLGEREEFPSTGRMQPSGPSSNRRISLVATTTRAVRSAHYPCRKIVVVASRLSNHCEAGKIHTP